MELESFLARQKNHPLSEQLPESFILPQYDGYSIANIPATMGQLLGVTEGWGNVPLDSSLLQYTDSERVILLLVDGVGYLKLQEQLQKDDAGFKQILDDYGSRLEMLTSTSPSTTSVATTTIMGNGACAAEHGMVGYSFLLPSQSVVGNMLFWHPTRHPNATIGELESWGIEPETFLPTPSLGQVLANGGVQLSAWMPNAIKNGRLSRIQFRETDVHGFLNPTDMYMQLADWCESPASRGHAAYAYYSDFDSLSHRDGHNADFWSPLWQEWVWHFKRFIQSLSKTARTGTRILITADHGHVVVTPPEKQLSWEHHPDLLECLHVLPAGEPRHRYLYARANYTDAIENYVKEHLSGKFHLLNAKDAIQAGLYGASERIHPETTRRIGDYILLAKGANCMWGNHDGLLNGMHGSLEPEEMLVPFIDLQLD